MAKEPIKPAPEKANPAVAPRAARHEALAAEHERLAAAKPDARGMDVQSGMNPGADTDAAKAALAAQFKAADAKGDARSAKEQQAVDEATVGRQIRGW